MYVAQCAVGFFALQDGEHSVLRLHHGIQNELDKSYHFLGSQSVRIERRLTWVDPGGECNIVHHVAVVIVDVLLSQQLQVPRLHVHSKLHIQHLNSSNAGGRPDKVNVRLIVNTYSRHSNQEAGRGVPPSHEGDGLPALRGEAEPQSQSSGKSSSTTKCLSMHLAMRDACTR